MLQHVGTGNQCVLSAHQVTHVLNQYDQAADFSDVFLSGCRGHLEVLGGAVDALVVRLEAHHLVSQGLCGVLQYQCLGRHGVKLADMRAFQVIGRAGEGVGQGEVGILDL
jgi:hypothetical protein